MAHCKASCPLYITNSEMALKVDKSGKTSDNDPGSRLIAAPEGCSEAD
jgi:hypothetical protein